MDWRHLQRVQERGVLISINPGAHITTGLADTALGAGIARKGSGAAGERAQRQAAGRGAGLPGRAEAPQGRPLR